MGRKTTARQHCSICTIDFYEFDWMHFGLCNALTTFQRLMERSMGDMHLRDWLIYHAVPEQGIHTDSSNIEAVHNLPVPRNVKEIRMFLGFTGYYRRFVKGYASILYGGLFVPFRYFVLSSFRLALWRGAKTK